MWFQGGGNELSHICGGLSKSVPVSQSDGRWLPEAVDLLRLSAPLDNKKNKNKKNKKNCNPKDVTQSGRILL